MRILLILGLLCILLFHSTADDGGLRRLARGEELSVYDIDAGDGRDDESSAILDTATNLDGERRRKSKACVSLLIYRDGECHGDPVRSMTFPTWTELGSPCYHDAGMANSAAKDQYCDLDTGIWHETVYPFDTQCETHWYDFWSKMKLQFRKDSCVGGYQLNYCKKGRCSRENEDGSPILEELFITGEKVDDIIFPIIQKGVRPVVSLRKE